MKRLIMSVITITCITHPIASRAGLCDLIKACMPACCTCGDSNLDHILVEASLCKKDINSNVLSHDYENYDYTENGFIKRARNRDEIQDYTQEAVKEKRITIERVDINQDLKRAAITYAVRIRSAQNTTVQQMEETIDLDQSPAFNYGPDMVVKLSAFRIHRTTRHNHKNRNISDYELEEVLNLD